MLGAGCVPELNTKISFYSKIQTETWSLKIEVYNKGPLEYQRNCLQHGVFKDLPVLLQSFYSQCQISLEKVLDYL